MDVTTVTVIWAYLSPHQVSSDEHFQVCIDQTKRWAPVRSMAQIVPHLNSPPLTVNSLLSLMDGHQPLALYEAQRHIYLMKIPMKMLVPTQKCI